MPSLAMRRGNRLWTGLMKLECVYALILAAVLVVGALYFTSSSGTLFENVCHLVDPTDSQLLAEVLQKLSLLDDRVRFAGSASAVLAGDAAAPGGAPPVEPDVAVRGAYLGNAARVQTPTLDDRMQVTIPLQIWQSVRCYGGHSLATATLFNSWTIANPKWDHFLLDKVEMHDFVRQHFEDDVVELFEAMPLDQMRVDVFRFMVLLHHGGVYADLDTLCMQTPAVWAPRGCRFAAAVAPNAPGTLSPAVVAAVAGDETIKTVLKVMLERMKHVQALLDGGAAVADVAYNTTGAGAFSAAVVKHVGAVAEEPVTDVPGLLRARADLRTKGVCLLTADAMAQHAVKAEVGRERDRGPEWDRDADE